MPLSKMHYQRIAAIINKITVQPDIVFPRVIVSETLINELTEYFTEDNPRFDADRFKAACKAGS